ncbi:hypothetical protein CAPTEDRAFT_222268 [Capitella teleta]|uniref:Uncharacterized protein n=1 Tax=Capitella teleta TaxID=283909 RepID=R7V6Z5_CAPTE|nr:hypothetical protein CAPTEDRAFT_222268 [Capitella teleta]|eukprot:ELU14638.1 hypothetical protein CAPTEDRAFT_222268 [Capitella teleta]
MGDSDSERDLGSDGEENEAGFDPNKDLENMTEKEKKKWDKSLKSWRLFIDFLFRHTSIITYRYNIFESDGLTPFMMAMEKAELLRGQTKLKKGEEARISSIKVMHEACDLLAKQKHLVEANRIKSYLDLAGRMRSLGTIAGGFFKAMKKGKVRGLDKIKHYLEYWKGFCVRSFDYTELTFRNADPANFNGLERKYLVWPTVLKTALYLSNRFLKRASESTGLQLMASDPKEMQKHMQMAEFVVATRIEDMLQQKVAPVETRSILLGGPSIPKVDDPLMKIPAMEEINPEMLKPIDDGGTMMNLPEEPPKEKKGRKNGKKGKKGKSSSASGHKKKKK